MAVRFSYDGIAEGTSVGCRGMGHILSAKHLNRPDPSRTSEYAFGYSNLRWLGIDCGSCGASVGCRGMGTSSRPNCGTADRFSYDGIAGGASVVGYRGVGPVLSANHHYRPDPPERRNTPSAIPTYGGWALVVVRTAPPSVAAVWVTSSRPITTIAPTLPNVGIRLRLFQPNLAGH